MAGLVTAVVGQTSPVAAAALAVVPGVSPLDVRGRPSRRDHAEFATDLEAVDRWQS